MTELEISKKGIIYSGVLSSQYQTALSTLTGSTKYDFDPKHPEKGLRFSSSLTIANKFGAREINITQFEMKVGPQRQLIYSTGPQKIQAQTDDKKFNLEGQMTFKITVTFKDKGRKSGAPISVTVPSSSSQGAAIGDWKPIIVGGAIFVGASVLTFGWADIVAGGTAIVGAVLELLGAESTVAGVGVRVLVLVKP